MLLIRRIYLCVVWIFLYQVVAFVPPGTCRLLREQYQLRTAALQGEDTNVTSDLDGSSGASLQVPQLHHMAIRTQNITRAISFYSMLLSCADDNQAGATGLSITKFRAGPARAAWLETPDHTNLSSFYRLELIEVPRWILEEGMSDTELYRAPDLIAQNSILGYNHVALEVKLPLVDFIQNLQQASCESFRKTVRVAVQPYTQIIGQAVYELAFIYDADGSLIELLHLQSIRNSASPTIDPWGPWDGTGFRG